MNKHVAAMLTMLIIPSAFAQTPLTDSKTIVIKPSALAVEMVPDIAYSFYAKYHGTTAPVNDGFCSNLMLINRYPQ